MSAVSQSYPNYLGGLNEQPDELKKPGQLPEALNVIPDPTIGLTRRPGFQNVPITGNLTVPAHSNWFTFNAANAINKDYSYYCGINPDTGQVQILNQDGETQKVKYTSRSLPTHLSYEFKNNQLYILDKNKKPWSDEPINLTDAGSEDYFIVSDSDSTLKFTSSKSHIVVANPTVIPTMSGIDPSSGDLSKYYSFINLKVVDTENYDYLFTLFSDGDDPVRYTGVSKLSLEKAYNVKGALRRDESLPLLEESPTRFKTNRAIRNGKTITVEEDIEFDVTVRAQVTQDQQSTGSYRNRVNYFFDSRVVYGGKGFKEGDVVRVSFPEVQADGEGITVTLDLAVERISTVVSSENRPIGPGDVSNMNAEDILEELVDQFTKNNLVTFTKAVIVGNGIYLESQSPFSVASTEIAVADVINSQKYYNDIGPLATVTSVSDLPIQCYDGFIVRVSNSFNGDNDYFLEYQAESVDASLTLAKADGSWEEVAKPFELDTLNSDTMPHMITVVRQENTSEFAFIVSPIKWEPRTVGDVDYNPSFIQDNSAITGLNYYKNRLIMLTQRGTIVTSRSDNINNIFSNTALTTSAIDPIDVVCNNNTSNPLYGSAVVNNGLLVFADSEQYMFTTNNDILTSDTVNVTKVSAYSFDKNSEPINLGVNVGFVSSTFTRFYETTNLYDRGPIDINERSQQIMAQFSLGYNQIKSSREQSMVVCYKRNTAGVTTGSNSMYMYRFRQENSQESTQTSWVKWELPKGYKVCHVDMPLDKLLIIVQTPKNKLELWKMDGSTAEGLPASASSAGLVPNYLDGWYEQDGEILGEKFETRIKFPTIYAKSKDSSDVNANLTIHRVKLSTAAIGTYDLTIERKGYDTYKLLVEQTPADEYRSHFPPLYGEKIETVPVYTRNKNLTLTISTDYNAPMTLQSMAWEGDYNRPYYKSV